MGYDVDNVLSTKVYSLLPSDQCAPERMQTRNITYGGLVLHAPEVDFELQYCMFQASYTVSDLAHSARFDISMYISEKSRLIPTYYPLDTWTCRSIWQNQEIKLPGFSDKLFILQKEDFLVNSRAIQPGEQLSHTYSATFFHGGQKAGIYFTWAVKWVTPAGVTVRGTVAITAQLIVGKLFASLDRTASPWSLTMTDPLGQSTSCIFPGADFIHDSVSYLPIFTGRCELKSIYLFSPSEHGTIISSGDAEYLSGNAGESSTNRVFYVELLNTTVSVCSYLVRPTTYSGVYFITEHVNEDLPQVNFDVDALPNVVYGTKIEFVHVSAHISRQRIVNFVKSEICRTRQMILNGLISLASNLDNPNLFLGSGSMVGVHAEKAGAVLYVHRCAKVAVSLADFPYCTEEVPVLLENTTHIRFMNPITQVVYPNYTLTACDPIAPYMYRTIEGVWMHYGQDHSVARTPESLSVFSHFDFSDHLPSLHTAGLFSYENLRKSARARVLNYSRRTIAGREVYLGPGNHYNHPGLVQYNPDLSVGLQQFPSWNFLLDMQATMSSAWYIAERATLVVLTSIALLGVVLYILKLIYAVRMLTFGVPLRVVFGALNPFAHLVTIFRRHRELFYITTTQQFETPSAPGPTSSGAHPVSSPECDNQYFVLNERVRSMQSST